MSNQCQYSPESVNQFIAEHIIDKGKISDGHHTFDELYNFRKAYNAALFNEWANCNTSTNVLLSNPPQIEYLPKYDVHKSLRHFDGELCFGGGWFIVVAMLPTGQISNHYKIEDWDLFKVPITEKAKYKFDGHSSGDVLERLKDLKYGNFNKKWIS